MTIPDFLLPTEQAPHVANSPTVAMNSNSVPIGGGSGGGDVLLNFRVELQEQIFWCWAAVSASVSGFYGSPRAQCVIASSVLPAPNDCCGVDAGTACNRPWNLDQPLALVGCYGCRVDNFSGFAAIQSEIQARQPLGCRVAWRGGGAHFMVVTGWSVDPATGDEFVKIHDPSTGSDIDSTHTNLCSAFGTPGDQWTHSYFTIAGGGSIGGAGGTSDPSAPVNA
jgi:hypothetical protein